VPTEGLDIPYYHWTFNMPTDHAEVVLKDVRVSDDAIVGGEGNGLACINVFTHENRIRQAASGVGAAQYCIAESVTYAKQRVTFGKPLSERQAIQWPLVELQTECDMLRNFVYRTAWQMDRDDHLKVSDKVSMCNYRANRLVCDAADRAIQVHGGIGYTRAKPFEHIYRHHRRYRITEGSEEVQIRNVAGHMFGYVKRG
jgi:alkylation response protein AidB-like acyl-CoA dehydrogenase